MQALPPVHEQLHVDDAGAARVVELERELPRVDAGNRCRRRSEREPARVVRDRRVDYEADRERREAVADMARKATKALEKTLDEV